MWDTYSDLTFFPFSVAVLVMQAAHPDIGAAVDKYSIYRQEPWGRMFRTGFSLVRFLYGGKNGALGIQEAKRLRALHAHIKGSRSDGTNYHALKPESFRIVPDTFLDGVVRFRQAMAEPLTSDEKHKLHEEYLNLCLLFGIKTGHLQANFDEFLAYYDDLLLNTMDFNPTVAFLLGDMMKYGPRMKYVPLPQSWCEAIYHRTVYPIVRIFTLGFIDPRYREKHGIHWSDGDQRCYLRWLKVIRCMRKIVPRFLRYSPFALYVMMGGHGFKPVTYERLKRYLRE